MAGPQTVLIAHSVLLELEWVLRAVYALPRPAILKAMHRILGLPTTHVDQAALIAEVLERYGRGFDFADVPHLVLTTAASPMVSFDRRFMRAAQGEGLAVELL